MKEKIKYLKSTHIKEVANLKDKMKEAELKHNLEKNDLCNDNKKLLKKVDGLKLKLKQAEEAHAEAKIRKISLKT